MENRTGALRTCAQSGAGNDPCIAGCDAQLQEVLSLKGNLGTRCPTCGLYKLHMQSPIEPVLDRTQLEPALRPLRDANYAHVLQRLQELIPSRARKLLDVGCSSGWFLDLAGRSGYECYGIEPDGFFYNNATKKLGRGTQLVQGYFPDDLPADWGSFDVITFHDVFEHFGEPEAMLRAAHGRLAKGGHLVFSLPVADGFAFHFARLLYAVGVPAPLDRMFQIYYPYPHLFYFTRRSFLRLARRVGMEPVVVERLRSFSVRGSLHRAEMDRSRSPIDHLKRFTVAGALSILALTERLLPADNFLIILRSRAR